MKKWILITLLYFTAQSNLWSNETIAEAIIVRGKVTVLELGELKAKLVKKGTRFKKDASILTGPRSFIRIRFLDKSTASLGPKSKMVVNQVGKKKIGLISLIKGKLRTKVIKKNSKISKKKSSHSLYIKTVTASLGVRGTDFQVLYNSKNKVTSLLTYEGEVQISKNKVRKKTLSSKTDKEILNEQTNQMEKVLNSKESVTVPKGQFSGVTPKLTKTTLPVKISPKQFTLLYKNDQLKDPKNLKEVTPKDYIAQAKQNAPLEGVSDLKSGNFAPRSGGFLDLETGLYVAPGKKSSLNKSLGVYQDKTIGSLSSKTGQYIPPKGLKLDAKKGFVPDKSLKDKKDLDKIKNKIRELNEGIKKQKNLFVKDLGSFLEKIKEIKNFKLKKPKKIKDLLHPNLMPDKDQFLFHAKIGQKKRSDSHKKDNKLSSEQKSDLHFIELGLEYGLTKNLSVGILSNLIFPVNSEKRYGPASNDFLKGVTHEYQYDFDHEGPFFFASYKHNLGFFKFVYKGKKEDDLAAITDYQGKALQTGSHALKERYVSLSYKKTWKRKSDFYSISLSFDHLGGKKELIDDIPLMYDIEQGPRNIISTGFEGQRNFTKSFALRGELFFNKSTPMDYKTLEGSEITIENLSSFNKKLSLLYQTGFGLWSIQFQKEDIKGTYKSGNEHINLERGSVGLGYVKDFSFSKD